MKLETIIALDIGKSKTGIAKADPMGIVVTALKTVPTAALQEELIALQNDYEITKLIIGLPINMDNTEGEQAKFVRDLVETQIATMLSAEIVYEDEKLSSEAASEILKARGIKLKEKNKTLIDSEAAALLLKQHFDAIERL